MLDLSMRLPTGFPVDTDESGKNRLDQPQYGYSQPLNAAFDSNGSNRLQKLRCTIEVDYDVYRQLEY